MSVLELSIKGFMDCRVGQGSIVVVFEYIGSNIQNLPTIFIISLLSGKLPMMSFKSISKLFSIASRYVKGDKEESFMDSESFLIVRVVVLDFVIEFAFIIRLIIVRRLHSKFCFLSIWEII